MDGDHRRHDHGRADPREGPNCDELYVLARRACDALGKSGLAWRDRYRLAAESLQERTARPTCQACDDLPARLEEMTRERDKAIRIGLEGEVCATPIPMHDCGFGEEMAREMGIDLYAPDDAGEPPSEPDIAVQLRDCLAEVIDVVTRTGGYMTAEDQARLRRARSVLKESSDAW